MMERELREISLDEVFSHLTAWMREARVVLVRTKRVAGFERFDLIASITSISRESFEVEAANFSENINFTIPLEATSYTLGDARNSTEEYRESALKFFDDIELTLTLCYDELGTSQAQLSVTHSRVTPPPDSDLDDA
jgi:hypothetical protein